MLANGGPDRGWRDDLGDAGRPNSAKINAVEWAIDVSLPPACLSGRNQGTSPHLVECPSMLQAVLPL
jgi:hypothetical protein